MPYIQTVEDEPMPRCWCGCAAGVDYSNTLFLCAECDAEMYNALKLEE